MEMGRARAKGRVGWPDNLYPCGSGYKYRNPVTKKEVWAGNDREGAFDAARKCCVIVTNVRAELLSGEIAVRDESFLAE